VLWASREAPAAWPVAGHAHPPADILSQNGAERWFASMRPFCNAVEVETRHRWTPPPSGMRAAGYSAACYALAGRIDRARQAIESVEPSERWRAAGVVFQAGHPVADAGDDRAAGPLMELVVEYWPNHYMALYHAGMARFEQDSHDDARDYLERFLEHYAQDDGWAASARDALAELDR
ncbi:MAG: tetratricopeptide repeat protein, partial [Gemmatimonadota bacterium]|nr:tetratricopeptide repeat protein [Gemmatimonadota bacterium]